eukprot:1185090-Prorocentrum_minimum.AAC.1
MTPTLPSETNLRARADLRCRRARSYTTVLDVYVLGCFSFLTLVTVWHASFPYVYGFNTVDHSPLTISPNTWPGGDEQDMVDWDIM